VTAQIAEGCSARVFAAREGDSVNVVTCNA
jgi:hypothetical protein